MREERGKVEDGHGQYPGNHRLQDQLGADEQRGRYRIVPARLPLFRQEQAKRHKRAGRSRAAEQFQKILRRIRNVPARQVEQDRDRRRRQQRVAGELAHHLDRQMHPPLFRLQPDLNQHDGDRKQDADRDDRCHRGRRHGVLAERNERQRKSHEAGIGVTGIQPVDRRIGEMPTTTQANGDGQRESRQAGQTENRNETGLPKIGPPHMDDDVEEQRGQRQIDHEAIEFGRRMHAENAHAARQPAGQDEGEDGQNDHESRKHGKHQRA